MLTCTHPVSRPIPSGVVAVELVPVGEADVQVAIRNQQVESIEVSPIRGCSDEADVERPKEGLHGELTAIVAEPIVVVTVLLTKIRLPIQSVTDDN